MALCIYECGTLDIHYGSHEFDLRPVFCTLAQFRIGLLLGSKYVVVVVVSVFIELL